MTLAELHALDVAALWAGLSAEQQAAIVTPLLFSEFANVTADDDGTDASPQDQEVAAGIEHRSFQAAMDAIRAAFPAILGDDFTALRDGPTAGMVDGNGRVRVKGERRPRKLHDRGRRGLEVQLRGRKIKIAGFKNLATEDASIWEAWTQAQIDEERVRRHPDQFVGPRLPAFVSVRTSAEPCPTTHHEDHSYDRAA